MTGMAVRQCPQCALRFTSSSELEHHLADDHARRPRAAAPPTSSLSQVGEARAAPRTLSDPRARTDAPARQPASTATGWLVVVLLAAVGVVAVVAWLGSATETLITAILLLALAATFQWRRRVRARLRR